MDEKTINLLKILMRAMTDAVARCNDEIYVRSDDFRMGAVRNTIANIRNLCNVFLEDTDPNKEV